MNIIAELNGKITTHLSTCMETALEDGTGLTGMVESTLARMLFFDFNQQ